jgi:hypothetical protein
MILSNLNIHPCSGQLAFEDQHRTSGQFTLGCHSLCRYESSGRNFYLKTRSTDTAMGKAQNYLQ